MNLNKVIIIGRLTQDPETRTTPEGQTVCNFSVATNRVWTDRDTGEKQEKTEYHNVVAWRKLAEICSQYLNKGRLVMIEGRIETRSWQDQNGNKRYRTEIIAENMQMGPRPATSLAEGPLEGTPKKVKTKKEESESVPEIQLDEENPDDEGKIEVKDIPF